MTRRMKNPCNLVNYIEGNGGERARKKFINKYLNVVWLFHMGHTGLVSLFGIFACFLTVFGVNLRVVLFSD